jgi:hypothetical protein
MLIPERATDNAVEIKSFCTFEIKDAEKGEVAAIVATLGVVDKDEDIITADAIKDGSKVLMSAYGHDAVYGARPAGKGALHVEGNKVVFKGRVFLTTTDGRDTFEVLKEMGGDQEWSFGFRILGAEVPTDEQRKQGARRVLTKLDCFEVSPVIVGAGVGTRTTGVKAAEPPVPDPAAEAARLEAEREEVERVAALTKQRRIDDAADHRFRRPPPGVQASRR